jgi:hypothetical protein
MSLTRDPTAFEVRDESDTHVRGWLRATVVTRWRWLGWLVLLILGIPIAWMIFSVMIGLVLSLTS